MGSETRPQRDTVLTFRVSDDEAREFRLAARAERTTLSEMIRRAARDRAEQLAERGNEK